MKKVGLVSVRNYNYGSILQAYALQQELWARDHLKSFKSAKKANLQKLSYDEVWNTVLNRKAEPGMIPGAFVDWDNTPRYKETITDLNFYVIDNQYITSWYDSGFVFLILCVFICVHFIIELTKIIVDKHIEISLRKKSLVLLIGMILVMFYSFIIDVLTWYQPIFIISFIIALSNWNIKEAKKECEYTR